MLGKLTAKDRSPAAWILAGAVALFVVLVSAQLIGYALTLLGTISTRSGLYAVFLTNGQVYFGNIVKEDDRRLVLNGIYYIQQKNGQPADASDVSLLKLGNELHGPEDWMEINRDHVLFVEKLKNESRVVKAIREYRQK